jgi:hypothetical protein
MLLGAALAAANIAAGQQQQREPRIGYVYPAGGRQGTTFEVKIGGQFLNGVTNVYVSGSGVAAVVTGYARPLTPKQVNDLREQLQQLQKKRAASGGGSRRGEGGATTSATNVVWTAEDAKMLAEIREKLEKFGRKPANPVISETAVLQVTIAPNAEPNDREIRLATPTGLSNPLIFQVGQLPEFNRQEPKKDQESGTQVRRGQDQQGATPPTETAVTLPAVVNGQILPGGVDRFRFKARGGQQLVVAARARALMPYLADAVPGWFQASLTLYDAKGKELAYDDDFQFRPDPVLAYRIPADGEYVLEIKDALYRGREDFVYRIAVGELPFVTSVFPLGGVAGAQTTVEVRGWNLPVFSLTLDTSDQTPGRYPFWVRKGDLISNRHAFALDALPEILEKEPNNSAAIAQPVTPPVIVNGRIDSPGDADVFGIEGRAGDEIVAEIYARRLDSPLDSVLWISDAAGNQLAFNDDFEDKGTGLNTHHADSYLRAKLTAAGPHYIHVGDAQRKGGAAHAYRLRISAPRPDFELRVTPSSINVRSGGSVPLTVFALRKDGFTNQIAIALKDAPAGFKLSGGGVPAGEEKVKLTLTAPATPTSEPTNLVIEGRAVIAGQDVVRQAVPAEDMMQAFAYRHLVPAKELKVAVFGRAGPRSAAKLLSPTPIKLPVGGTARVRVGMQTAPSLADIHFELSEPADGIAIESFNPISDGFEIVLRGDPGKVKPGAKGNLIINMFARRAPAAGEKPKAAQRRAPLGSLPAISYEITAP